MKSHHPKHPATILEQPERQNGYRWVIKDWNGCKYHLAGLGAPLHGRDKEGDQGFVQFQSFSSRAGYVWLRE